MRTIEPEIAQAGVFQLQVCVPRHMTDAQVIAFAESQHPAGTSAGWVLQEGVDNQRGTCAEHPDKVHILLTV